METPLRFDSLLVHGGLEPGPAGATSVPIVQSSSFAYETAEALEDVFRGRAAGQVYTRLGNPIGMAEIAGTDVTPGSFDIR